MLWGYFWRTSAVQAVFKPALHLPEIASTHGDWSRKGSLDGAASRLPKHKCYKGPKTQVLQRSQNTGVTKVPKHKCYKGPQTQVLQRSQNTSVTKVTYLKLYAVFSSTYEQLRQKLYKRYISVWSCYALLSKRQTALCLQKIREIAVWTNKFRATACWHMWD